MLVRLLGKEDEALAGDWNTPFTDVADWAKPYVGYAYANGLTAGVSQTRFGSESSVTAKDILKAMIQKLRVRQVLANQVTTDVMVEKWEPLPLKERLSLL